MSGIASVFYSIDQKIKDKPLTRNVVYTIVFGVFSLLLGELKFYIPDLEGGTSDFREIPLLISIFFIRNPIYLLFMSLITAFGLLPLGSSYVIDAFIIHFISLVAAWWFFKWLSKFSMSNVSTGLLWMLFVLVYYAVFLMPLMVVFNYVFGVSDELKFWETYVYLMQAVKFEVIATSLVTGLYFIQFRVRRDLEAHKRNLEGIVKERTSEIAEANERLVELNEELMASSDQIKSMNENLDELVKERSKKIEDQLQLMVRYAHMNAHDVRAPLARILGLLYLVQKEERESVHFNNILEMLHEASLELDSVINKMNKLLEREIFSDKS